MGEKHLEKGNVEVFDYVEYSLRRYHNHQLHAVIRLDGMLEVCRMESAVIQSFQDLPQLCATWKKDHWEEEKAELSFRIEVQEGDDSKQEIATFFSETVLVHEPFQVKLKLFRAEGKDTLAIVWNHMLGDTIALKQYLYLLCELYNTKYNGQNVKKRYGALPRGLNWTEGIKPKHRSIKRKMARQRLPIARGETPCFLTETIMEEKMQRIEAYVKKRGVSQEDYFLAAYYKAVEQAFRCEVTDISSVENLRGYYEEKSGLSNQFGFTYCSIKESTRLTFEQLLHTIHRQREEERNRRCSVISSRRLARIHRFAPKWMEKSWIEELVESPRILFQMIGTIEEERLALEGISVRDCYITDSLYMAPMLHVAISRFKGGATIGCNMLVSEKAKIALTYFIQVYYVCLMEPIIP